MFNVRKDKKKHLKIEQDIKMFKSDNQGISHALNSYFSEHLRPNRGLGIQQAHESTRIKLVGL